MKTLRFAAVIIILPAMIMISGCATTSHKTVADLSLREKTERILLMPMDIELSELTAGGVLEPNAAWTAAADRFVHEAISEKIASQSRVQVVDLNIGAEQLDAEERKLQTQLIKLHEAVGQTILPGSSYAGQGAAQLYIFCSLDNQVKYIPCILTITI